MVLPVWVAALLVYPQASGAARLPEVAPQVQPSEPPAPPTVEVSSERLIDALRSALSTGSVGAPDRTQQAAIYWALRSLRDPALAPLFANLARAGTPAQRSQGILGLAELTADPPRERARRATTSGGVDLLLVRRIEASGERAAILDSAMDQGLLSVAQAQDVARWPDLDPPTLVAVAAYLRRNSDTAPQMLARELALRPEIGPGTRGALILALSSGGQREGLLMIERRSRDLVKPEHRAELLAILGEARRGELAAAHDIAAAALARVQDDPLVRDEAARLMLLIRPSSPQSQRQMLAGLEASADLGQRLRVALAVLEAAAVHSGAGERLDVQRIPYVLYERLGQDADPLIRAIGAAVAALVEQPAQAGESLEALVETAHAPSIRRLLERDERLPQEPRARLLSAVVRAERGWETLEHRELMMMAAERLMRSPDAVWRRCLATALARRQATAVSFMLLAALRSGESHGAAIAQVAQQAGGWPSQHTADIATLVLAADLARRGERIDAASAERAAALAGGAHQLTAGLRAQAAWIALRATNQDRAALARILADVQ